MNTHTKLGIFPVYWCKNHKKIPILTILNLHLKCARFCEMGIILIQFLSFQEKIAILFNYTITSTDTLGSGWAARISNWSGETLAPPIF